MNIATASELIGKISSLYPNARQEGMDFVLDESESHQLVISPVWADEYKSNVLLELSFRIPIIPFLTADKQTWKKVAKASKKIAKPRGFEIHAEATPYGGVDLRIIKILRELGTPAEFKEITASMWVMGIATFNFFSHSRQ